MSKLLALVRDTIRDLMVRKVIIVFLSVVFLGLLGLGIYLKPGDTLKWAHAENITLTPEVITQMAYGVEVAVSGFFGAMLTLIAVFSTASVIPSVLEKGTIDLYLSKPVSRGMLIAGKALGSLVVVAGYIALFIVGSWILLSLKFDVWNASYLGAGAVMLFSFVVLYSVVVLLNVLTRGSTVSIIVVYLHVLVTSGVLAKREAIFRLDEHSIWRPVLDTLYTILPHYADHSAIALQLIVHQNIHSYFPLWGSAIIAAACYSAAVWVFSKKEY